MQRMTVCAGLVFFAVAACGQQKSTVRYNAEGGQTVTIADKNNGTINAQIGSGATMPTDLPLWAPAYPGSTVVMAQNHDAKTNGGVFENVMLQTPDDLAKVSAFYDQKLVQAGVKSIHTINSPEASIRMVETPSSMISINAAKNDEGGSTISISKIAKS